MHIFDFGRYHARPTGVTRYQVDLFYEFGSMDQVGYLTKEDYEVYMAENKVKTIAGNLGINIKSKLALLQILVPIVERRSTLTKQLRINSIRKLINAKKEIEDKLKTSGVECLCSECRPKYKGKGFDRDFTKIDVIDKKIITISEKVKWH